jgi:hypothetical protein
MLVRELLETDRPWAAALVARQFGSTAVVSRGVLHDTRLLPGMVVVEQRERVGLLQYRRVADQLEIVVLIACRPRQGAGVACSTPQRTLRAFRHAAASG